MRFGYLLVLLLAGCATPEQRQARIDTMIANMGRACEKIGHAQGSEQYKECVTRLLAAEAGRPPPASAALPTPARTQTTCLPTGGGGMTCY